MKWFPPFTSHFQTEDFFQGPLPFGTKQIQNRAQGKAYGVRLYPRVEEGEEKRSESRRE